VRLRFLTFLLGAVLLAAGEDPFESPPDLQAFARRHTVNQQSISGKLGALVKAFFDAPEQGGLGITYDNAFTRTPMEAWRDRKANCLTLTVLYMCACRSIGLEAWYAESIRIGRWRREGSTVRFERHIVAVVRAGVGLDLMADFLPEVRRGSPFVKPLESKRVLALFHSNRAVEMLGGGRLDEALAAAHESILIDPGSGVGWNILGVVQRHQGLEDQAESSFHKSLEVDPKDGAPCGNLEDLLRAQGRLEEAQAYRNLGLDIRKGDPYFNAFLAEEALQDNRWTDAEKRIKMALRLLPQEPDFYLLQARLALAQGQPKEAIKALEKARKWSLPEMRARYDTKLALLKGEMKT
jgi:Flp pilus assembly protein TadD